MLRIYDKPLNGSNFIKIRESINQLSPESTDHTHLVFKEGMYFSDGWSIMGWDYDKNRIQKNSELLKKWSHHLD